jgi:heterotetrameric sarcosine oxidase gamma subunit
LLVGDGFFDRAALLRIVVGTDIGAVTDLSQTRCRIRIQGAQCRTVLNLLFALDMHAQDRDALAFPVGNITMTGTDAAPCTLHRLGLDAFDLYLPSASAPAQLTRVLDAAQAFGVSLQHC